jgi:hypothetical protein
MGVLSSTFVCLSLALRVHVFIVLAWATDTRGSNRQSRSKRQAASTSRFPLSSASVLSAMQQIHTVPMMHTHPWSSPPLSHSLLHTYTHTHTDTHTDTLSHVVADLCTGTWVPELTVSRDLMDVSVATATSWLAGLAVCACSRARAVPLYACPLCASASASASLALRRERGGVCGPLPRRLTHVRWPRSCGRAGSAPAAPTLTYRIA